MCLVCLGVRVICARNGDSHPAAHWFFLPGSMVASSYTQTTLQMQCFKLRVLFVRLSSSRGLWVDTSWNSLLCLCSNFHSFFFLPFLVFFCFLGFFFFFFHSCLSSSLQNKGSLRAEMDKKRQGDSGRDGKEGAWLAGRAHATAGLLRSRVRQERPGRGHRLVLHLDKASVTLLVAECLSYLYVLFLAVSCVFSRSSLSYLNGK